MRTIIIISEGLLALMAKISEVQVHTHHFLSCIVSQKKDFLLLAHQMRIHCFANQEVCRAREDQVVFRHSERERGGFLLLLEREGLRKIKKMNSDFKLNKEGSFL
jgi:hypothetical protein